MVDFDTLTPEKKNSAIEHLIMELPPVVRRLILII